LPLEIGYNLILPLLTGLVACLLWSIGRRLGGTETSGLLAVFIGLFAGSPDGLRQLVDSGLRHIDIWKSSRQVTDTITEMPLFTIWLGDLHPHLLCLPLVCLAVLVAMEMGKTGPRTGPTLLLAVLFGTAWAANPWAMPPTIVAIGLLVLSGDGRWHWPVLQASTTLWQSGLGRWLVLAGVAAGGWLVTAPFHLDFEPPIGGIGFVLAKTSLLQLALYGGCLLLPAFTAAGVRLARSLAGSQSSGWGLALAGLALLMLTGTAAGRPVPLLLAGALVVLLVAVLRTGEDSDRSALALAALGLLLLLVPEILYVKDTYGEQLYRMNTVFKSYFQAWLFLAMAAPVLLRLGATTARVRRLLTALVVAAALPHLLGLASGTISHGDYGVDGLGWMSEGDRALVEHLRAQPYGTTLVEAVGPAYSEHARLSAASGAPAYLGWANHEHVWRGGDIHRETQRRQQLVERIYGSGNVNGIRAAVAETGADLVAIGSLERKRYPREVLSAVIDAGTVDHRKGDAVLVRFPKAPAQAEDTDSVRDKSKGEKP
jgi:YYY domain-containing protein